MSLNLPIPIIKLEVEGMRRTMAVALSQYTAQLDEMLQQAISDFCTPENLERIINDETARTLDTVIKAEVKNWFINGEGRKAIKKAVEKRLQDGETWTPLDYE